MAYTPRGHAKKILDTMGEQSVDLEWTAVELAEIVGIPSTSVPQTVRAAIKHGLLFSARKGRSNVYSLSAYEQDAEQQGEQATAAEFDAAVYLDGGLVIWGAQENEDGSVTITAAQLAKLKRLTAWSPAP